MVIQTTIAVIAITVSAAYISSITTTTATIINTVAVETIAATITTVAKVIAILLPFISVVLEVESTISTFGTISVATADTNTTICAIVVAVTTYY